MNVSWHGMHPPSLEIGRAHVLLLLAILALFVLADVPALHCPPERIWAATMKTFATMGMA